MGSNRQVSRRASLGKENRQKGIVHSYLQEFGYELLSTVPEAYMLHHRGKLRETVSGLGSKALYYFSPRHKEIEGVRGFMNTKKARQHGAPYTYIHKFEREELAYPPYASYYKNKTYKWEKPTLCICNRYNREWKYAPINYFTPELLDKLFGMLSPYYHIVYWAVDIPEQIQDENHSMELGDRKVAEKHNVMIFNDICKDWNETMLMVFANCSHFITMNGGYSILASYFSGTNIIYTKLGKYQTKEIKVKSFWRWYPNINGVRTIQTHSYEELIERVQTLYVDNVPVVNVYTENIKCLPSLLAQDYKNVNIIFGAKTTKDIILSREYNVRMVRNKPNMELIEVNEPVPTNYISQLWRK